MNWRYLLCLIGIHQWNKFSFTDEWAEYDYFLNQCWCCGKEKWDNNKIGVPRDRG